MRENVWREKPGKLSETEIISVTYYTDPLCCWSWAMHPALQELRSMYPELVRIHYRMGGLIPSWEKFSDPVNSITRPTQMGPVWMHASKIAGVPINHQLWLRDPPASSYPACIAFKCVQLQSERYAERYLQLLQEAAMINGINISRKEELVKLAKALKKDYPSFNTKLFLAHLTNGRGRDAFRRDVEEVKSLNITRFPSMIFRKQGKPSLLLVGYRTHAQLVEVINQLKD